MEMLYLIFFFILIFTLYISLLTGFFAIYYYDCDKYKNIDAKNIDLGYTLHVFILSFIFFIIICTIIFYNKIIGIILFILFILSALFIRYIIKRNMKNIIEIYYIGIDPPAFVKFNSKILTMLLSPFSYTIFSILLLIIIFGLLVLDKVLK